ncbi:MAG: DNA mismatch repair protein MutS [Planctomycetaceae bacterium]|jgi:DNA mismatch repair protein MutS|nr:DNA mismatch repair protein MutS [Planctomycetaceae bacterium]
MSSNSNMMTPMMKQYLEAKKICPEALLLFRMGDFYEMFLEDARIAAQVLGLALTSREKGPNAMPMAGFPHHQLDSYIAKLIAAGYRAAVCEQMEDPKKAKGIVKREVTRIVTAGTLTEETLLNPKQSNFLASICQDSRTPNLEVGLAWVELSTGEFFATTVPDRQVAEQIARISPSEIIFSDKELFDCPILFKVQLTKRPDWTFGYRTAQDLLLKQFGTSTLEGYGFSDKPVDKPAIRAAGAILSYLNETQRQISVQIDSITLYRIDSQLEIDEISRRNLEITTTIRGGNREGSLLSVIDRCITAMGSRLIADFISSPLANIATINARLDAVEELYHKDLAVKDIRENLRRIYDLQRILTRILQNRGTPRDLVMIARTLRTLPFFRVKLEKSVSSLLKSIREGIDPCESLFELLSSALEDEAPINFKDGGFIRSGFNTELDELRHLQSGGKDWIAQYQAMEVNRTGIPSLKVGYTQVFGYYIEITNAHRDKVPKDYVRKMTLKNAERYITPLLKEYEEKILTSKERANIMELELFEMLCKKTCEKRQSMQSAARALAALDVIVSLALIAREGGYCRPQLIDEPILKIVEGRHPVLDTLEPAGTFVPNDTLLDDEHGQIQLITGPNMAGKSTFIRQTALLCVMAQMGSFLPAREAVIGICDRIFARVGASDEISRGQSTFMVEMTETARILNQATHRSLVILDEVGRGTSTYDGISLAWAIVEYLHDKIGCRTLFASHYHELTDLSETYERIRNLNVAVKEQNDNIAFLHKIIPGAADKSYGIYVAKIAGIPKGVVKRAREILDELEQTHVKVTTHSNESEIFPNVRRKVVGAIQFSLFGPENHPVIEELRDLDVDNLKPLNALQLVAKWKDIVRNRESKN